LEYHYDSEWEQERPLLLCPWKFSGRILEGFLAIVISH
jgi:hypothetical protein